MSCVWFILWVPTEKYELKLKNVESVKTTVKSSSRAERRSSVYSGAQCEQNLTTHSSVQGDSSDIVPNDINDVFSYKASTSKEDVQSEDYNKRKISETFSKGSPKKLNNKTTDFIDCPNPEIPMEVILVKLLKHLGIVNALWTNEKNGSFYQVNFPMDSGVRCEEALSLLQRWGFGIRFQSLLTVLPCTLLYHATQANGDSPQDTYETRIEDSDCSPESFHTANVQRKDATKTTAWNRFVTSVRSRLTVAQVVESVEAHSVLTFDFLALLVIASLLAALGLTENSNVFLVSSMLISPLMAPVIAGTFGTVIQDRKLLKIGVTNELIGLGMANVIGFFYGLLICSFSGNHYGGTDWPTPEMLSWCTIRTLWIGSVGALLSGAAVALGILGDHMGSLVGVAISASLMPPAVNAGLLWSMTLYYVLFQNDESLIATKIFSENEAEELALLGVSSICLTFLNIIFIYIAGILVFKIKEVAPISSKDQARRFWKYDIRIARDYNKTVQAEDGQTMRERLAEELANNIASHQGFITPTTNRNNRPFHFNSDNVNEHRWNFSTDNARNKYMSRQTKKNQVTWSLGIDESTKPTIQELNSLYYSVTREIQNPDDIINNLRLSISKQHNFGVNSWTPPVKSPLVANKDSLGQFSTVVQIVPTIPKRSLLSDLNNSGESRTSVSRKFIVTPAIDPLNMRSDEGEI